MKKFLALTCLLVLLAVPVLAQEQFGRIEGKATTADGKAIAGAKVVLSSNSLIRAITVTTDDRGRFRFQLLPVGEYTIKVTAEQYKSFEQSGINVQVGALVTLSPVMQVGEFEEVITISGEAPVIDVKSTDVSQTLTNDLIAKLPTPRFPTDMLAMAAGMSGSADGGSAMGGTNRGNSYQLDGIDTSDPGTGTVWVFVNSESIDQMEILPISGATADVGGFTGAAMNMVTKSGGNEFSGGVSFYYFDEDFITWNTEDETLRNRTSREALNRDATVFLGGPLMQDQAWFFTNYGRAKRGQLLNETLNTQEYRNGLVKGSVVLGDAINVWGTYHYDNYIVTGRGSNYNRPPETTYNQDSPNHSYAGHLAWSIDDDNLFEAKIHGWDGYFALEDQGSGPRYYDVDADWNYGSAGGDYRTDRVRTTVKGQLTHYQAELAGDHEFKFGVEYHFGEQDTIDNWDYIEIVGGQFDYREKYSETLHVVDRTKTLVLYGTDTWTVNDRLTVNVGVRFENPTYNIPDQPSGATGPGDLVDWNSIAPRIGATYKIDEDGTFIARASFGHYYQGMMAYEFSEFTPDPSTYDGYLWDGSDWFLIFSIPNGADPDTYSIDDDIGGYYAQALTFGLEKQVFENISVAADYIHRTYEDFIIKYEDGRVYQTVNRTGVNGKSYTLYNWVDGNTHYTFTNDDGTLYSDYDALILRVTKNYSDNWQLQASLTLSRLEGNIEDTTGYSGGAVNAGIVYFQDPNNQINAGGKSADDIPWNFKLNGTYTLPYEISLSTILNWRAGNAYSLLHRFSGLDQGNVTVLADERGSESFDTFFNADIRVEKEFRYDRFRASVLFDAYNVFNNDAVVGLVNRVDLSTFGDPTQLQNPRRFQVGVRFAF